MGYILRVRLASFFAGAATASFAGLFFIYKDYKFAHESITHQIKNIQDSFDQRISSLEKVKSEVPAPQHVEATE